MNFTRRITAVKKVLGKGQPCPSSLRGQIWPTDKGKSLFLESESEDELAETGAPCGLLPCDLVENQFKGYLIRMEKVAQLP